MNTEDHPCFSEGARHRVGRIHLPVAPRCNMQCNYCNRDYACTNESRPGVARSILSPRQASDYLDAVLEKIKGIRVVGIAGPGDPFANVWETLETLRRVRENHPELLLCVATNGLEVGDYVDELARLNLSHVSVTVNAVDPTVGSKIYAWARIGNRIYRSAEAAGVILGRQIEGIRRLKEKKVIAKINTVIIPGVNDGHVGEVAKRMAILKADIMNCIPMYHVAGTPFEGIPSPTKERMDEIRDEVKGYLPLMSHCGRCRADAAGRIGEVQGREIADLLEQAARPHVTVERPHVAVASMEGLFVNQHLGEAAALWIFGSQDRRPVLIDRRSTPLPGGGSERWEEMAKLLGDCSVILVSGIGPLPQTVLERAGIQVVVMEGMAKEGLEAVLTGKEIPRILLRRPGRCGMGQQCSGDGMGCI